MQTGETIILGQCLTSAPGSTARRDLAVRFAILNWPDLQTDAAGLMALYYGGTRHQPFVTSSPALAAQLGATARSRIQLKWKVGLNWIPSPGSRAVGVARLLRDQTLNIPGLAVAFCARPVTPLCSVAESEHMLASGLAHVFQQISKSHGKIYLALTAGLDSRTLFAVLLTSGIRFEAITQSFPGVNSGDLRIAAELCRHAGVRHRIVQTEEPDVEAVAALSVHTADSSEGADGRYLIPGNAYRFVERDCALIRGGCFEIGRRFYHRKLGGLDIGKTCGKEMLSKFSPDPNEEMSQLLDEWLAWRRDHDDGLDLTDSFYLDQRLGGWLSAVEQRLDVLSGNSIQPVNCERFFSSLTTPSRDERRAGALQLDIIRHLDSSLLKIPINPLSMGERLKKVARTGKRRMKAAMQWVHCAAWCIFGFRLLKLEKGLLETVASFA